MSGQILVNGHPRRSTPAAELEVRQQTMFLPDDAWMPEMRTARQWAYAVGQLYPIEEQLLLEHIDALIQLFDLKSVADSLVSSYSAGQKKKAQLIMALAPLTPVLVLDEPFSGGLDPTGLFAIKDILRRRAKALNHTILVATPTPELVEEIADRIVILRHGEISAQGTISELRAQAELDGSLAGIYEKLSSSDIETRVSDYEQRFLAKREPIR